MLNISQQLTLLMDVANELTTRQCSTAHTLFRYLVRLDGTRMLTDARQIREWQSQNATWAYCTHSVYELP